MSASTDIQVLHAALKDAEDELCALGHVLVNQGQDTDSITLTIDVLRIALYGTDGRGNGPENFERARAELAALRSEEAASVERQPTAEGPACRALQDRTRSDTDEQLAKFGPRCNRQ